MIKHCGYQIKPRSGTDYKAQRLQSLQQIQCDDSRYTEFIVAILTSSDCICFQLHSWHTIRNVVTFNAENGRTQKEVARQCSLTIKFANFDIRGINIYKEPT